MITLELLANTFKAMLQFVVCISYPQILNRATDLGFGQHSILSFIGEY